MRSSAALPVILLPLVSAAFAGGSNYGIAPGAKQLTGKVSEWPVPPPKFARDPAPGPDGNIYITVMQGDRIARFDTKSQKFNEWDLPPGAHPHGLVVDNEGKVWYTGNGNGTIGELDPASGKVIQHKTPSGGSPHTLVIDETGTIWFTNQSGSVGRLDRSSGKITEYKMSGGPYGLALDRRGNVWGCRMSAGKLAHVDPAAVKIIKEYEMPAGTNGGPYAVTVDGAGRVFANEIQTDTVAMLDPKTEQFQVFRLPSKNVGIRKAIVDAQGRFWYMGSHNGRLGVIE